MRRILPLLLALTSPALAQDKFAELQIDAAPFAAFLGAAIIQEAGDLCPEPAPAQLCNGQTCYLDRLDVQPGGTFRRSNTAVQVTVDGDLPALSTAQLQYVQPLRAHFKSLSCIRNPSCARDDWAQVVDLHLLLDLGVSGNQLCVTPAGFLEPVPADVLPSSDPICAPLALGAIRQLAGPEMEVVARGLSANDDESVLAVRVELLQEGLASVLSAPAAAALATARTNAWQAFLDGDLAAAPVTGSPSWRLHLTDDLLRTAMARRFAAAVHDDPDTSLDGPVDGLWWPFTGDGILGAHFFAEIDTHICPNLIGAEVHASLPLALDGDAFRVEGKVTWDTNDADVGLCGALFGGFVFAPVTMPIAAAIADSFSPDPSELGAPAECDAVESQTEDNTVDLDCTFPLALPDVRVGNAFLDLQLADSTPSPLGLTIHGAAHGGGPGQQIPATEATVDGGFGYGIHGNCSAGFSQGYSGGVSLRGPRLCDTDILSDPHHVFDVEGTSETTYDGIRTNIDVDFPAFASVMCPVSPGVWAACPPGQAPLDQYWLSPYPLTMTLWTTRGAFTVQVPGPVKVTEQQQLALSFQAVNLRVNCMAPQTGLFGIPGLYDPRWDIDPPPYLPLERVTRLGRERIGQVALTDLVVSAPEGMLDRLGALRTRGVPLQYRATAVIDAGRAGRYRVPVTIPLSVGWRAEGVGSRVSALRTSAAVSAAVDLTRALPSSLAGAGFTLQVPAGAIGVSGR